MCQSWMPCTVQLGQFLRIRSNNCLMTSCLLYATTLGIQGTESFTVDKPYPKKKQTQNTSKPFRIFIQCVMGLDHNSLIY